MLAGRYRFYEKYEFSCALTDTAYTFIGDVNAAAFTATLENTFTPDYFVNQTGVKLIHTAQIGFGAFNQSQLQIPALFIGETRSYGTSSTLTFNNLTIEFLFTGFWHMKWDSIVWKVDGTTEYTHGSGSISLDMSPIPSSVPIVGNFPILTATAGVLAFDVIAPGCDPGPEPEGFVENGGSALARATGGFRVDDGDGWSELYVILPDSSEVLSHQVYHEASSETINPWAYVDRTSITGWQSAMPGKASQRGHTRLNSDFEEIIFRGELPEVPIRHLVFRSSQPCSAPEADPTIIESTETFIPEYVLAPQFLAGVGSTPHTIEAPTNRAAKAPYRKTTTVEHAGAPATTLDIVDYQLGPYITDDTAATPAYGHVDWIPRFQNTWGSPGWSFWPWFPQDDATSSVRWDLLGADSDITYWYTLRQQHATHPALPTAEDTQRRLNIVSDPITQNGTTGRSQEYIGLPCWWGINEFSILDRSTHPADFTTDSTSADRFAFKDGAGSGTGSVGASVTLTTGDAIEFEMASFTSYPFMTTTLADRLKITWSDSNISAVKLFAVGADDSIVQIGPTAGIVSATTYRIPYGDSEKWATSAGIEFGAGYLTDNHTPDAGVSADDITAATIGDNERVSSFALLPGFSPSRIRIEITRAGSYTGAVSISHPTFYMAPWEDAKVFHESASVGTILFKNGPMVRYGSLSFFNYATDTPLSVPLINDPVNLAPTIGDAWAFENCFLLGNDAQDGLYTRMIAKFINGDEVTIVDHLWRDPDSQLVTLSFVVQGTAAPEIAYYNSMRNLPPTSMMPNRKRTAATEWRSEGEFGQWEYELSSYKHPHIVPGNLLPQLIESSVDHLENATSPDGWTVRTFSEAVDNNETQSWMFHWSGVDWFEMRPWRGQAFVGMEQADTGEPLTYDVLKNLRHCLGYIKTGTAWLSLSETNSPYSWVDIDTGETADYFDIAYHDGSGDLYLSIVVAGAIKLFKTTDEGGTLTSVMTLGSGDYSAIEWTPNNILYAYRLDSGGTLYGRVLDAQGNTIVSETATNLTGLDQAPFDVRVSVSSDQKQVIGATYKLGGNRMFKTAPDGFTFS